MNTELRKNAKNDFEKYFFRVTYHTVFQKAWKNVRKPRDANLS